MKTSLIMTVLAAAVVVGCSDKIVGTATVTGRYDLITVNGAPLPFATTSGTTKTEILDDVINFYQGYSYAETIHLRVTTNGQAVSSTKEETGTYAFFGTSVTVTSADGTHVRRGLMDGKKMSLTDPGMAMVFSK